MAAHLSNRGYAVDLAGNGEEALLKLSQADYDCVVMDLRMPGLGGEELYRRIFDLYPATAAKVLFMTGDVKGGGKVDHVGVSTA